MMQKKIWTNKEFVHLHCHSLFSIFDGLIKIPDFVKKARTMGFPALALTDHGNLGGAIKFITECIASKDKDGKPLPYEQIKPIIGQEFYFARELKGNKDTQPDGQKGNKHLLLSAKDWEGYKNLCSLSHIGWTEGFYFDPRIDFDTLSKHSKGIICSSACLGGLVNSNLRNNRFKEAKEVATIFKDIFGDDFFLEVMFHGIADEYRIVPAIIKISALLDIPIIATNDVHYLEKKDADAQEIFVCAGTGTCITNPNRMKHSFPEFYLKSAEEMAQIFGDYPQFLMNTVAVSERVNAKEIEHNLFDVNRYPTFKAPEEYKDQYDYLCKLAWAGLKKLGWDKSQKHIEALKKELIDVKLAQDDDKDFASNFLIVRDCIQYAKSEKFLCGYGRGSGFASVLLRCLGIFSGADPLQHGLLWERFLGFDEVVYYSKKDLGLQKKEEIFIDEDGDEDEEEVDME